MKITILVPTYRRTHDLARCLVAAREQSRPADEVLLTVRDNDEETQAFLAEFDSTGLPLHVVSVTEPGGVAAMNAGLKAAQGDIVALTDDDAAPFPDWLERIEAHFLADSRLGAVGGRDRIHYADGSVEARARAVVGKVQWHGRVIGNHHLGVGPPREVDVVKGVSSAYRVEPLREIGFDTRLQGAGMQIHWELSLSLALKKRGWKIVYDPALAVDHYMAPRLDADVIHRGGFNAEALQRIIYNETLIILGHLSPPRRAAFLGWAALIGTREAPGFLQLVRITIARKPCAGQRFAATVNGRRAAVKDFVRLSGENR